MKDTIQKANIETGEVCRLIESWIFNERDRAILKRRLIDGIRFEPLAEEFGLSVRQVKKIVYRGEDRVLAKIPWL